MAAPSTVCSTQIPRVPSAISLFPLPSMPASTSHLQPSSKDSPWIVGGTCRLRKLRVPGNFRLPRTTLSWGGRGRKTQLSYLKSGAIYTPEHPQDQAEAGTLRAWYFLLPHFLPGSPGNTFLTTHLYPNPLSGFAFREPGLRQDALPKERAGKTAGQSKTTATY